MARKQLEAEHSPQAMLDLEKRLQVAEADKRNLSAELGAVREELASYHKLTETLKNKIRDMSTSDGRDFLDSFEEVMREEMMTMKVFCSRAFF